MAYPKRRPQDPQASLPLFATTERSPLCLEKDDSKPLASLAGPQQRGRRPRTSCGHQRQSREVASLLLRRRLQELKVTGQRRTTAVPGRGRKAARACAPPRRRPEEPGSGAAARSASRRGAEESAGRAMRPLDSAGAAEVPEPGLRLADDAPQGAIEEPAAAEAGGTPGPGRCWLFGSSPCGLCAPQEAKKKAPCPGLGLFYTLLSAFLFSVASLFVKKVQDVHAVEISAFRCVFQMLVIIPCLIYRKTGFIGPKGQRIFLFLRGVLGSTAMILLYYAFQATSLADATVITFSSPVFTSIFACIFLKEKYSPWDALFTVFTITGVILIVRPPFLFGASAAGRGDSYSLHLKGTIAAVTHAVFAALTLVILRKMGKSVDYFLSIWYYVILGLLESIIVLFIIGEWSLPYCGLDRLFLILIGLFGLGGQVFLTKAIQIEKAGPVAIMKTMDVVFAFIFQIIFFNDVPTWWTVGGALCVIASSTGAAVRKWCQGSK